MTIGFTALTLWFTALQSSRLFSFRARSFLMPGPKDLADIVDIRDCVILLVIQPPIVSSESIDLEQGSCML